MKGGMSDFRIKLAGDYLAAGGVVAHPTEAVWGLAALAESLEAVTRLLQLKQRDPAKGLIMVSDTPARFSALLAALPAKRRRAVLESWPGPTTWVVPDPDHLTPPWVRGGHDSVALRVSNHSLTAALCAAVDGAIVSTSANPTGGRPALQLWQARRYFGDRVDYYLGGETGGLRRPTTIVDALSGEVLRPS